MTRRSGLVAAAYLSVAAAALLLRWRPAHYAAQMLPLPDALEYAVSALALLQRGAYALYVNGVAYPPEYPFGFPLLLTPAYAVFGPLAHNGAWASLAYGLALLATAMLVTRRLFGDGAALVAGIVLATSRQHILSSQEIMSDAASTLLILLAVYLLLRAIYGAPRDRYAFGAGLLAGLAVCVRLGDIVAAIALALAVFIACAGRRASAVRALASFALGAAPGALALLAYNWFTFGDPLRSGYQHWNPFFSDTASVFSLRYLTEASASDTVPTIRYYAALLLGLDSAYYLPPFALAIAGGLVAAVRRGSSEQRRALLILALLAAANLSIYSVYRYQYPRFAMTACTALTIVGAHGVVVLVRAVAGRQREQRLHSLARVAAAVAVTLIAAGLLLTVAWSVRDSYLFRTALRGAAWYESTWRYDAVRFLNEQAPDDAWIVSALPAPYIEHYVLQNTQRFYVPITRGGVMYAGKPPARQWLVADEDAAGLEARLRRGGSVYLLADPVTAEQTQAIAFLRTRFAWREKGAVQLDRWGDVHDAVLYQLLLREQ